MSENIENIDLIQEPEPSSFRLILALGLAGFFSGLLLVSAFIYTRPLIESNRKEALQLAIFKVLPGCNNYATLVLQGNKLVIKEEEGKESGQSGKEDEALKIFAGFDASGTLIGFAIPASEPGFQDIIGAIYGYEASEKMIIGFEVLESKETPGLGDKIFKDADFKTNFNFLEVDPEIMAVKKGQKSNANEVEAITGATISSKAIVRMLNNSLEQWKELIEDYVRENKILEAEAPGK